MLTIISTDKIISVPAPQEEQKSEEDITQSEMEPPCKSRQLHIEINSASNDILPIKQNIRSLHHMMKGERVKKATEPIPSTYEADVRLYKRLMEEMAFEPEMAEEFCKSGAAAHILKLKDSGFVISESDPLIIISADPADPASVSYFNNGNYGLPAGTPGGLVWPGGVPPAAADPLPAGMAMKPPAALGRFLAKLDGVRELSLGSNIVFYVKDMGVLHTLPPLLIREPQFRRIGPVMSALTGNAAEDDLVRVYTLDKMSGPAQLYPHFTSVP